MITLVRNARPCFVLAVEPSQDAESVLPALSDLVTHLKQCIGQIVWFQRQVTDEKALRLVVALDPQRELGRDAFEIHADSQQVRLTGSTPQAVHHAVCHFLEQAFGVRWLWPGPTGTVTPKAVDVTWPIGTQCHEPAWRWRRLWLGGAFFEEDDPTLAELKYGPVQPATLHALHGWQRRQRLEGLKVADGHRWAQICSPLRYGQTHPEYFALVDGQRDTVYYDGKHCNQPCTSNPKVVELTANYIIGQFRAQPQLDGFSLSLNDSGRFCECQACTQFDAWAQASDVGDDQSFDRVVEEVHTPGAASNRQKVITDRIFYFANQVAEQVAKVNPDKWLLMLVYGQYRQPPRRIALHPNVIAQFCAFTWSHVHEPARRRDLAILDGLQNTTTHRGIYDYFVNGKAGSLPRGFAQRVEHSFQAYYQRGCRFFATQAGLDFATNGFAYYFAARLLWDMNQSYQQVLEDYCQHGFGPACQPIQRYLHAYVDRWEQACPVDHVADAERLAAMLYPANWRQARGDDLAHARELAAGSPAILARIDFLQTGLAFLNRYCELASILNQLNDAGAPLDDTPEALAHWCSHTDDVRLQQAADGIHALNRWLDDHADGFYVAAMWMRYQMKHNRIGRLSRALHMDICP